MEEIDIVELLRGEGYCVVEGMEATLQMMEEMAGDKTEYGKRTRGERQASERR